MCAHALSLSHPGIRCRCLAAYGDAVSAVKWYVTLSAFLSYILMLQEMLLVFFLHIISKKKKKRKKVIIFILLSLRFFTQGK